MPGQLSTYIIALAVSALGTVFLGVLMGRRRMVPGAGHFSWSMYALAAWSATVILTHLSDGREAKLFWTNAQYFGITIAPLMWLLFVLRYTGQSDSLRRRSVLLLSLHPVLTVLAVWTDPYHHLFRRSIWLDSSGPVAALEHTWGPAFWIHAVYMYSLLLMATYFLIRSQFFAPRLYRRQGWALLAAVATPWLANLVTITGINPLPYLDLTPFGFTISAIALAWGLLRYNLLDLAPAAREAVMDSMTTGVIVLDHRDRVVDLNPAAEELLTVPIGLALSQQLSKVFPQYSYMISRFRGAGEVHDEVSVGEGTDQRTYDLRVSPLRDSRGEVIGHLVSLQDVTKRKHAELALSRYAERLRIFHEIDSAILAARSPETIALAALNQIHHLLPVTRMSVVALDGVQGPRVLAARGSSELVPERAPWAEAFALVESGSLVVQCVNEMTGDSGESPLDQRLFREGVRSYMVVPLVAHGVLVGSLNLEETVSGAFQAEHRDVTSQIATSLAVAIENARLYAAAQQEIGERKIAQSALKESETVLRQKAEDLEQRNAELDAFAHTVAHDLKTPLSLLMGYASFMEADDIERRPEDVGMCIRAVGQASRKMSSIIDELLLLASVRKQEDVERTPMDTEAIVRDVEERLADLIEHYEAEIVGPDVWPIAWGYAPWVEEVWVNYISNAIKYGGSPPRVELGAAVLPPLRVGEPNVVRFWVNDNGDGLSESQRARLFIPFERLEQARAQGYGLGLSIVQRIMEKLGGESGVESSGEVGAGSLFYFELPEADI